MIVLAERNTTEAAIQSNDPKEIDTTSDNDLNPMVLSTPLGFSCDRSVSKAVVQDTGELNFTNDDMGLGVSCDTVTPVYSGQHSQIMQNVDFDVQYENNGILGWMRALPRQDETYTISPSLFDMRHGQFHGLTEKQVMIISGWTFQQDRNANV